MIKTYSQFLNEGKSDLGYMTDKKKIANWLEGNTNILTYWEEFIINDDFTVDIKSTNLMLYYRPDIKTLPIKFGKIYGDFQISSNSLTSLKNCPYFVDGDFNCNQNYLTSLEGIPKKITGGISLFNNPLTSLVFAPKDPGLYENTECDYIYDELGFTTEAHVRALLECDPDWKGTLNKLKVQFPKRYKELIKNKILRLELGLESKELKQAYDISKGVEGDFY